jgi:hypothetical protein
LAYPKPGSTHRLEERMLDSTMLRRTAVGVALGVAVTGMTMTAASAGEPTDQPIWEERADRLCDRVPRVQKRVDRLLDRLRAGSDVEGSIAWLTDRADQARDDGHDDLATFIEHRATIRTERIDVLEARADALADAATWCADRDNTQDDA